MSSDSEELHFREIDRVLERKSQLINNELRDRTFWFIKLRWLVPIAITFGIVLAKPLGFDLSMRTPIIGVAVFILIYNFIFWLRSTQLKENQDLKRIGQYYHFIRWQVGFDYFSMFLLVHFTGGIASPLIFFFIFHIFIASVLMTRKSAYWLCFLVVLGMCIITTGEYLQWLPNHALVHEGESVDLSFNANHAGLELLFFSVSIFVAAFIASSIMNMVRRRISDLVNLSFVVKSLNDRLNALFSIVKTIGSVRNLDKVLITVTKLLAQTMEIQGVSIKLLSEDGQYLNYLTSFGLGDKLTKNRVIEVKKSPLNERVIKGETYTASRVTRDEMFQFGEDLAVEEIKSVLFVPLMVENKVIGILGGYSKYPEQFDTMETDFFRLAAGLVAVVLDNTMTYEKVKSLNQERTWFILKAAHNLKSPLSSIRTIINVIREGYLGELNDDQEEYLRRVSRRAESMTELINDLLQLAKKRKEIQEVPFSTIDLNVLIGRIDRSFRDAAQQKKQVFNIKTPGNLPEISGNLEMLEQMLENLISNAIKYTPEGGEIAIEVAVIDDEKVRIDIEDNGIGIPEESLPLLFNEFHRAENAKLFSDQGTGLGMSIVKEILDRHQGSISLESKEGIGTRVTVLLWKNTGARATDSPFSI